LAVVLVMLGDCCAGLLGASLAHPNMRSERRASRVARGREVCMVTEAVPFQRLPVSRVHESGDTGSVADVKQQHTYTSDPNLAGWPRRVDF
jgi:hypothetical protein